jgi:hypothetical protein
MSKHPMKTQRAPKQPKKLVRGECTIPPRVPDAVLNEFTLGRNEHEADAIKAYVEWQCAKDNEHVTYLEKVQTEHVFGAPHGCWNVRTEKERYWVITNPTNLYSQELFPSLDYTLSFHIGVTARIQSRRKGTNDDRVGDRLAAAFRRWEQAAEALDQSSESEEVQAVGMRCRECLITFVRAAATPAMVPNGQEPPKAADVLNWSELIADTVASGSRAAEIRGYLKALARATWQLVAWLTHATNATRYDGTLAVDATYAVLNAYGAAILRHEQPTPDRCPRCNSLRITIVTKPDFDSGEAIACDGCGWIEHAHPDKLAPGARTNPVRTTKVSPRLNKR